MRKGICDNDVSAIYPYMKLLFVKSHLSLEIDIGKVSVIQSWLTISDYDAFNET